MADADPLAVTVVIPTFDRGDLIERAVDSVLAQSRPAAAVVVVDDGSTDDTLRRLERYGVALEVVSQPNRGASHARNAGVALATTPWVAFCDSDDRWEADHLDRLLRAVEATGGAAALYFDDLLLDEADGPTTSFGMAGLQVEGSWQVEVPVAPWLMGAWQPMLLQSSLIRTEAYRAVEGLAPELRVRHDTHLFFRIGFAEAMCAVAGIGGALCADADGRLTDGRAQRGSAYWEETIWMYADLVPRAPVASVRRRLQRKLAATHLKVGIAQARGGRVGPGAKHLVQAVIGSPVAVAQQVGRAIRKRLGSARSR